MPSPDLVLEGNRVAATTVVITTVKGVNASGVRQHDLLIVQVGQTK